MLIPFYIVNNCWQFLQLLRDNFKLCVREHDPWRWFRQKDFLEPVRRQPNGIAPHGFDKTVQAVVSW